MNIRIHDVAGKPAWLARIDASLHDAAIDERITYDEGTLTVSLTLTRIGYEHRTSQKKWGFLRVFRIPSVPCTLAFAPVRVPGLKEATAGATRFSTVKPSPRPAACCCCRRSMR